MFTLPWNVGVLHSPCAGQNGEEASPENSKGAARVRRGDIVDLVGWDGTICIECGECLDGGR